MHETAYAHPTATLDSDDIGANTRIWAYVHLMSGVSVGANCNISDHVLMEADARLDDGVTVKPFTTIGQETHVEEGVFVGPFVVNTNDWTPRSRRLVEFPEIAERYEDPAKWCRPSHICRGSSIGAGAVLAPGINVGEFAMVGMGSIVIRSVPAHRMVFGNPAKIVGWVCFCGFKLLPEGEGGSESKLVCAKGCGRTFDVTDQDLLVPTSGPGEVTSGA